MELIRGIHNFRQEHQGCVATIGNFDGVHLGHQQILQKVRDIAALHRQPTTVMVFEPQPREFFAGQQAPPRLSSFREKLERLAEYGAERVVCLQFNQHLCSLSAKEFIQNILLNGLGITHLVVGDDFRFGHDRTGDYHLLQQVGEQAGFSVEPTPTFLINAKRVSSTWVREVISASNFALAAQLLGRPYKVSGRVVHGKKLGRQLGTPTANLLLGKYKPALAVVFNVMVCMPNGLYRPGIANIGVRPTLGGLAPAVEVHLHGINTNLYGLRLDVYPLHKVREEQKFASLTDLQTQIQQDVHLSQAYFMQHDSNWQSGDYWLTTNLNQFLS